MNFPGKGRLVKWMKGRKTSIYEHGYRKEYDKEYGKEADSYQRYQSVIKRKIKVESEISFEKGLAVESQDRDRELTEQLKNEKYTFENPYVVLNPYGRTPLCAYVMFQTEGPCKVRFLVKGKTDATDIKDEVKNFEKWHRVPIYGLYPSWENQVTLELLDERGNVIKKKELILSTGKLPQSMEDMVRIEKKKATSSMKLILVTGKSMPYPMAFDEEGEIRYMMKFRPRGYGFFPLANGRFIVMERQTLLPTQLIPHSTQMYEMDYLGRVYRTYYVPNGIHHDVCEMTPGGNLLIASNSQCGHVEDCIAEVNRENGRVEAVLDMREIFGTAYRDRTNWVHINSLDYDSEKKQVYFSARNIHTIGCIDWKRKKLKWILGEKNMWKERPFSRKLLETPEGMPWHFQQHSAKLVRENLDGRPDTIHIMIFDNHWHVRRKNKFFDQDEQSYVTIYTIDEKKKKAWIEKRFGGIKSKITSNGILKGDAGRLFYMGGFLAYPEENDNRGGYIYEFDYESRETLNEYSIRYFFFRAYELCMNMEDLSNAMDLYEEPCVGWLQPFEKMDRPMERPQKKTSEAPITCPQERIRLRLEDQNLQIKSRDHLIQQVAVNGKKYAYQKDFRKPAREQDLAAEMEYYVSIPLYNLEEDTYEVYVRFADEWYDSGETFTITSGERRSE
ncbi:MAG: aryl-sulfate sulfotransferase [Eubacterium sp.]|nr:aryl-sulfate sulfotransferase [Eubacterium sp.]